MHTIKKDHTQTDSLTIPSQKDIQAALCCRHTEKLQQKLSAAHVAIAGLGGLGSNIAVSLARAGVGHLHLIDFDAVDLTNLNRQIIALEGTVGRPKVEVAKERVLQINPDCRVEARQLFFTPENAGEVDFTRYDYVADAIDTVTSKIELLRLCREAGVPAISCMGAGNKLDPTAFRVAPVEQTSVCPLARVMRRELKKRGITGQKVLYSLEPTDLVKHFLKAVKKAV